MALARLLTKGLKPALELRPRNPWGAIATMSSWVERPRHSRGFDPDKVVYGSIYDDVKLSELPAAFSWADKRDEQGERTFLRPVRRQACNSCWSFVPVASIENVVQVKTGDKEVLSVQQALDCDSYSHRYCRKKGEPYRGLGFDYSAMESFILHGGICSDKDYPYTGNRGPCRLHTEDRPKPVATIDTYGILLPHTSNFSLVKLVAHQSAVVRVNSVHLEDYRGGVHREWMGRGWDKKGNKLESNHLMLLAGYETDVDDPYWILRNSWGDKWGEEGYMRVAWDCGIGTFGGVYPIIY